MPNRASVSSFCVLFKINYSAAVAAAERGVLRSRNSNYKVCLVFKDFCTSSTSLLFLDGCRRCRLCLATNACPAVCVCVCEYSDIARHHFFLHTTSTAIRCALQTTFDCMVHILQAFFPPPPLHLLEVKMPKHTKSLNLPPLFLELAKKLITKYVVQRIFDVLHCKPN